MSTETINVIKQTNDASFNEDVVKSELPAVVIFTAKWSGPSQVMLPILETVCRKFEGKLNAFQAMGETSKDSVAKFGIRNAPTIAIFKEGKLVGVRVNRVSDKHLIQFIDSVLD